MRAAPTRLVISNDLAALTRVAEWVNAWAERHEVPAATAARLDLCSTEALTNIIQYGYDGPAPHDIRLRLEREDGCVKLEIEDDGRAFDPTPPGVLPPAARLETAPVGGWGIPIIHRFSDELRYRRVGDRNVLTIHFKMDIPSLFDDPPAQATE